MPNVLHFKLHWFLIRPFLHTLTQFLIQISDITSTESLLNPMMMMVIHTRGLEAIRKCLVWQISDQPLFSLQARPHQPLCFSLHGVPASARWGNPSGSLPITSRCRFPRLMSITMISTSSLRSGLGGSTGESDGGLLEYWLDLKP